MSSTTDENILRTVIAIVGALGGGFGIRLLDKLLSSGDKRLDDQAALRKELREEAAQLRKELRETREAYDKELRDAKDLHSKEIKEARAENTALQNRYNDLNGKHLTLSSNYEDLQRKYDTLAEEVARLREIVDDCAERRDEEDSRPQTGGVRRSRRKT